MKWQSVYLLTDIACLLVATSFESVPVSISGLTLTVAFTAYTLLRHSVLVLNGFNICLERITCSIGGHMQSLHHIAQCVRCLRKDRREDVDG